MRLRVFTRIATSAITSRPARASLQIAVTAIALAALGLTWSYARSVEQAVGSFLHAIGPTNTIISARSTKARARPLTRDDVKQLQQHFPEIIFAGVKFGARDISSRTTTIRALVVGTDPNAQRLDNPLIITTGYALDHHDHDTGARVLLLSPEAAAALYPGTTPVGEIARIESIPFRIKGIAQSASGLSDGTPAVWIPLNTATRRLFDDDSLNMISYRDQRQRDDDTIAALVEEQLNREKHTATGTYFFQTPTAVRKSYAESNRPVKAAIIIIATVMTVLAMALLANMMIASVNERTVEIGLRRSVGATRHAIYAEFAGEAMIITLAALPVGLLLLAGVVIITSTVTDTDLPFSPFQHLSMEPAVVIYLLLGAIALAILSALLPAYRAANIDPVQALRSS